MVPQPNMEIQETGNTTFIKKVHEDEIVLVLSIWAAPEV